MQKYFLYILLFTNCFLLKSQTNLVPNPSFETYTTCPTTNDNISQSVGWSSYSISPDYYNSCNGSAGLGVPSNEAGYQAAATGVAYAGFVAFANGGFVREIIGGQLSQTLTVGQKYYASMKVSLCEYEGPPPQFIPCNKVGLKFSTLPYNASNPVPINNYAQVYTNSIISDTMNWTIIKGSFIADSAYKYIMLGNFFDDAHTDTISRPLGVYSYFYLDDICVSTDSLTCYSITGIDYYKNTEALYLFPNPASAFVSVKYQKNEECAAIIYNVQGEKLLESNFINSTSIDLSGLSGGVYFLNIQSKNESITKKLILNPK